MSRGMLQFVRNTAVLLALLIVVPTASARHVNPTSPAAASTASVTGTTCHQYCGTLGRSVFTPAAPAVIRTEIVPAHRGFQWEDAAIGFGLACGLILLAAGALVFKRRTTVVSARAAG